MKILSNEKVVFLTLYILWLGYINFVNIKNRFYLKYILTTRLNKCFKIYLNELELFFIIILDPQLWVYLSFHPSVLPSFQSFLEIGSLVFTETQHGLRTQHGHAMLCVNKDEFWRKKIFFFPNMGKMEQKWVKTRVFWIYWKI